MAETENPLISTHKSSENVQVLLHPLVLLTVSDYITRFHIRNQDGPIVGALLGQQKGRELTLEHAFECTIEKGKDGEPMLDEGFFLSRLQQYKDVHKDPALEFVGWFSQSPSNGPQPYHLPIHNQILKKYFESAIFLAFHPTLATTDSTVPGGKLPLTIYESVYENDISNEATGEAMQVDSEETEEEDRLLLKFRELPYSIETGEAEMIAVDFVARGGGNATAVPNSTPATTGQAIGNDDNNKGKGRASPKEESINGASNIDILTPEEEDQISTLTTRLNATNILSSRITLLHAYLSALPPSYLTTGDPTLIPPSLDPTSPDPGISQPLLRHISALLTRLSLLNPPSPAEFQSEAQKQENDVKLIEALAGLGTSVNAARDTGKKFALMENGRRRKQGTEEISAVNGGATLGSGIPLGFGGMSIPSTTGRSVDGDWP
ncbi:MAG: hypothetical protein M1834_004567 [Cirrosporium novae-zelandiae]|nr:MAG: hypothetical protein M1834_004567 [Cirrosporium novae-zelandiae]